MNGLRAIAVAFGLLALRTPTVAAEPTPSPPRNPPRPPFVAQPEQRPASSLYAARVLREMRAFLRLRMLELREADLDRVRAVIEHRLSIDDLIGTGETTPAHPR